MSSRVTICHIVWPMLPYFYWGFGPSGEALGLCHTVRSLYSLPFGKSGFPFPWLLIRLWGSCDSVAFGCTRWIYGRVHRWATLSSSLTSTQAGLLGWVLVGGMGCSLNASQPSYTIVISFSVFGSYLSPSCDLPWFSDSVTIGWAGRLLGLGRYWQLWHTFLIIWFTQAGPRGCAGGGVAGVG